MIKSKAGSTPRALDEFRSGQNVTIEEIQDVMADGGYSASQRKGWLKTVLTDLQQREAEFCLPNDAS